MSEKYDILNNFESIEWYKNQEKNANTPDHFLLNRCWNDCIWYWTGLLISPLWNEGQLDSGNIVSPEIVIKITQQDAKNFIRGEIYELENREVIGFNPSKASHLQLVWNTKDLAWRVACLIREYDLIKEQRNRLTPKELASLAQKNYALEFGVSPALISPMENYIPESILKSNVDENTKSDLIIDLFEFFNSCIRKEDIIEVNYWDFFRVSAPKILI